MLGLPWLLKHMSLRCETEMMLVSQEGPLWGPIWRNCKQYTSLPICMNVIVNFWKSITLNLYTEVWFWKNMVSTTPHYDSYYPFVSLTSLTILWCAQAYAEADTFFCFVELLSGFRDNFCKQLDNSVVGIRSTLAKLSLLLKRHDEELWRHLEVTTKVRPFENLELNFLTCLCFPLCTFFFLMFQKNFFESCTYSLLRICNDNAGSARCVLHFLFEMMSSCYQE